MNLSVNLQFFHNLSVHLSIYLDIAAPTTEVPIAVVHQDIVLNQPTVLPRSICISIYLSIYLHIYLSIYLDIAAPTTEVPTAVAPQAIELGRPTVLPQLLMLMI